MHEVTRKYDLVTTRAFDRMVDRVGLDEYEKQIVDASLARFCGALNRAAYHPRYTDDGRIVYEFHISVFERVFRVVFLVRNIEATGITFEETFDRDQ